MDRENGRQARDLVRAFDQRLLAAREYDAWLYTVPYWFLEGMALMLGICGMQDNDDTLYISIIEYGVILSWEFGKYLKFQGQSVYELLAYYPVVKKDIFLVRLGYLKDKLIRRLVVLYLLQIPFILHQRAVTESNIQFPLIYTATALVFCGLDMLPAWRRRKPSGK